MACCVVTSYAPRLAALGMMLVAERYARRGLGRYLMDQVVREVGATPLSLFATSEGQPLYENLGFRSVGRTQRFSGTFRPADGGPGPSGRATVRPAAAGDLPAMLRLDAEVFGADRTHVLTRLPAFADHIRVAEEDGRLTGFGALWPSGHVHAVGPLVARDTDTATALFASLAGATDRELRVDVDGRHEEFLGRLGAGGLQEVSGTSVMTLGAPDLPGDRSRLFAPLSVAMG